MLTTFSAMAAQPACDVCVVGAGPVGIALALACEDRGLSVLLVESGRETPDRFAASLGAGHRVDRSRHAAPEVAASRGLGGTSRWWGGRCTPYDAIDFADRPYAPQARWPIAEAAVTPWYPAAAAFFGIGPARFEASPAGLPDLGEVRFDQLERWTPQINAAVRHRERLAASRRITVVLGATVTDIGVAADGRRVDDITLADPERRIRLRPPTVVLACGGLETTRLLLAARRQRPDAFGGPDGPLGRGYMGHLSGKIADIVLTDPAAGAQHDFALDDGVFVRRRFTLAPALLMREDLQNISFWADNPPFHRPEHDSPVLSLVWLALSVPPLGRLLVSEGIRRAHVGPAPRRWAAHLRNAFSSPARTAADLVEIVRRRFLSKPRKPGFLLRNAGGRYALHYHAEQSPVPASTVALSDACDALGLPFLDVRLTYASEDARSVARAHGLLDAALRQSGTGRLDFYDDDDEARLARIMAQAADGFHQIGTARMAASPAEGVVDPDCRVHGVDNLFVASSAVFPSSGQAGPTFLAVALAFRLAAHLAGAARGGNAAKPAPADAETCP